MYISKGSIIPINNRALLAFACVCSFRGGFLLVGGECAAYVLLVQKQALLVQLIRTHALCLFCSLFSGVLGPFWPRTQRQHTGLPVEGTIPASLTMSTAFRQATVGHCCASLHLVHLVRIAGACCC